MAKRLVTEGFDFELWILGDGEQRTNLNRYIKDNRLGCYVKLWGFKSNPYKYLKVCDYFISSSRSEGFSLVIAEAMILGLPVLSTYCSGPMSYWLKANMGCWLRTQKMVYTKA